jgi:hypothetical protein
LLHVSERDRLGLRHGRRREAECLGTRAFCRVCGSKAPLRLLGDTIVIVPAGILDDDPVARPVLHQFAGSKAPWWETSDSLPRFEKWVPGYEPEWAAKG